jgi:hypothetical protein
MAKVMIIFSAADRTILRWIIPDTDAELEDPRLIDPGEAGVVADVEDPYSMGIDQAVEIVAASA